MQWLMKYFHGKPLRAVKFIGIVCDKRLFLDHIHVSTHQHLDIDLMEKYGHSITAAKAFMEQDWFITDKGNLICGEVRGLMPLHVSIPIDTNLDFLSSYSKMSYITIVPLHIVGFHKEKNELIAPVNSFSARFLSVSPR